MRRLLFALLLITSPWLPQFEALGQKTIGSTTTTIVEPPSSAVLNSELVKAGKIQNVLITVQLLRPQKRLKIAPGVVLSWLDEIWQTKNFGSGFFIGEGLILTNSHVGKNDSQRFHLCQLLKISEDDCQARIVVQQFGQNDQPGQPIFAKVIARNSEQDILLLSVPTSGPTPAHLAENSHLGASVYLVANKVGRLNEVFSGTLVNRYSSQTLDNEPYHFPLLEVKATLAPGNSGSALREISTSEVVAMTVAKESTDLGYAIFVEELNKFLRSLQRQGIITQVPDASGVLVWSLAPSGGKP